LKKEEINKRNKMGRQDKGEQEPHAGITTGNITYVNRLFFLLPFAKNAFLVFEIVE
jgi:hypothetical protein